MSVTEMLLRGEVARTYRAIAADRRTPDPSGPAGLLDALVAIHGEERANDIWRRACGLWDERHPAEAAARRESAEYGASRRSGW